MGGEVVRGVIGSPDYCWLGIHCHLWPPGHGRTDDECDRARHREDRLLGTRLDRDQEKLLR